MPCIDDIDREILERVQGDLPAGKRPFDAWARELGLETRGLLARLASLRQRGVIRSIKAVLRHRNAGFSSGAMVAWAVPGKDVERIGPLVASRREVSHCYERPGFGEYNLFSMVHGRTKDEVLRVIGEVSSAIGIGRYQVYWSVRELKKSSMRYLKGNTNEQC